MSEKTPPTDIVIRSGRFVRGVVITCVAAEMIFVLLDYYVNYGGLTRLGTLRRLTNIAREDSLASWFGVTQTMLVGVTLWMLYVIVRHQTTDRRRRFGWAFLAAFFTFMAADDGAMLHERAGTVFGKLNSTDAAEGAASGLGRRVESFFPSYDWQIVVLPLFVVAGVFILWFLWRELDTRGARLTVLAALACFAVAVGLDFIEGLDPNHPLNLYTRINEAIDFGDFTEYRFGHTSYDTLRHFSKSIEEFLEMLANSLFWYVFLRALTERARNLRIRFTEWSAR